MELTLSGAEPPTPDVILPAALGQLLTALSALTIADMHEIAVIGGMAVNIRLATVDTPHRATLDIDVVARDGSPTVVEVLSRISERAGENTVVVHGVEIDVIETEPINHADLDGLGDDAKLFVVGHRWGLDTAGSVRITTVGANPLTLEAELAKPAAPRDLRRIRRSERLRRGGGPRPSPIAIVPRSPATDTSGRSTRRCLTLVLRGSSTAARPR